MSSAWSFARRHKWKLATLAVVGGTSYTIWRALRGLPVRQLLAIAMKARAGGAEQVDTVLKAGEGNRLLNACLRDLRNDLASIVDIQEKQAAAKAVDKHQVQEKLAAFQELAIASLTRSIAAVYVVCTSQLLLHSQIFELVRLQKSTTLHEEAQRRFLSIVQRLSGHESGPLPEVVRRVEKGVRRVLEKRGQSEMCDAASIGALFVEIREEVEGREQDGSAPVRDEQAWLVEVARELLLRSLAENRAEESEVGGWMVGEGVGLRLEREVRGQVRRLGEEMAEVVESELFAEALAAALHDAFRHLSLHVVAKLFNRPLPPADHDQPSDAAAAEGAGGRATEVGGEGEEEGEEARVALLKVVPVVSNLFMSIMHPERQPGANPFTAVAARSGACLALFEAVFASAPAPSPVDAF